jgi:hypothetical protein
MMRPPILWYIITNEKKTQEGEKNNEILAQLGYSHREVDTLAAAGVIEVQL